MTMRRPATVARVMIQTRPDGPVDVVDIAVDSYVFTRSIGRWGTQFQIDGVVLGQWVAGEEPTYRPDQQELEAPRPAVLP